MFATRTDVQGVPTDRFEPGDVAIVRVAFDNWFAPGSYLLTPSLARAGAGTEALDARVDMLPLTVHSERPTEGLVDPPHAITIERR